MREWIHGFPGRGGEEIHLNLGGLNKERKKGRVEELLERQRERKDKNGGWI